MKNYVLLLLLAMSIFSCTMKDENQTLDKETSIKLLTAHKWHGVSVTQFINDREQGGYYNTNEVVRFDTERNFVKTVNGSTVIDGSWNWMNNPDATSVLVQYPSASGNNQNVTNELIINILTNDYLEYSIYSTDGNSHTIRSDYFYKK